jgi:hypothetical protein
VVEQGVAAHCRVGAGRAGLDDQGASGLRFGCDEVQQGFQSEAQPVPEVVASLASGGLDPVAKARGGLVEGGEEAGFLVGEMLVEGGTGDPGPLDHLLDVGFAVAEFGGGAQHGRQQALVRI